MPEKVCIIVGGGISGPVAALVLSRISVKCTIYELRDAPATIGGAVNLTPNALRLLEDLGVAVPGCVVDAIEIFSYHTGSRLGEISFRRQSGHALRVVRSKLQGALLEAVKKAGVPVEYGRRLVSIDDDPARKVVAHFENGSSAEADFILGCDGMYSAVRLKYVEPGRVPIYTGASTAYSIVDATGTTAPIHFSQTGLNSGQYGSLLTSYIDPRREGVYLAAVMETPEQASKEGWKAQGMDHEKTSQEVKRRYWNSVFPCIREFLEKVEEWTFYPVCRLEPRGKWSRGRVIILGDAAHGMPPQGESTGLAIEDSVLFARVLEKLSDKTLESVFEAYEKTRRPRIDAAYTEATSRWEGTKDRSWFGQKILDWFTWIFLWYKADEFEKSFSYDVRKEEIVL